VKNFSPLAITDAVVGFPARVGVITRRDGVVIRFAESDEALTIGGDVFAVIAGLRVSAVKHTNNGETPSCQIVGVHGVGLTFDSAAIDAGLFDGAEVQLYMVDRLNLSQKGLLFTGSISNIGLDPVSRQVSFDVKGPSSSARVVMTQTRSPMCRTDLFSPLCQLNKTSFDVSATVVSVVSSFAFTVSGLSNPDGYFNQGVGVTSTGVAFEIASWVQSTQTITAYLPSDRVIGVGVGLTLYPGCDKTDGAGGCGKFSNWINFQGENHFLGTAAAAQQV
jgi:uncharacterized phage protein (TIGR02218 family)